MTRFSRGEFLPSFFYIAAVVFGVLCFSIALFAQHILGMAPCAWCVFQRLILVAACLFAFLAFTTYKMRFTKSAFSMGALFLLCSIGGIASAWHQYTVAANQFSCSLTFADKTITQLGLDQSLPKIFGIQASCMDAKVNLLGMDFALWSFYMFVILTALGITALWLQLRQPKKLK